MLAMIFLSKGDLKNMYFVVIAKDDNGNENFVNMIGTLKPQVYPIDEWCKYDDYEDAKNVLNFAREKLHGYTLVIEQF